MNYLISILTAAVVLGAMGVIGAVILGVASKVFEVKQDERLPKLMDVLPGANCGACGYAGCANFADGVIQGKAEVNGCPVGGASVATQVSEIMGIKATASDKEVAYIYCNGGDCASRKFAYEGEKNCHAASLALGGDLDCKNGCLGYGSCKVACPFDAIEMINGVAKIIKEKCTSCSKCVKECPKNLISLVKDKQKVTIPCSSTEKGGVAKKACKNACIGCKLCQKACPFEAIEVENNLAKILYDKCKNCGKCVAACPQKIIENTRKVVAKPVVKPIIETTEEPKTV